MNLISKNTVALLALVILFVPQSFAQDLSVYAVMETEKAIDFQENYPNDIQILSSTPDQTAVILSEAITHTIRESITTHGPGYIYKASEEDALVALEAVFRPTSELDYTITEDVFVNACLDLVDAQNIETTILDLQNYGTRYHTKPQAEQSVLDTQAKWDALIAASGRTDISTRIYNHVATPMPSLILTIEGASSPEEYVIVGGHIDSTSWNNNDAPGADDNASGIASLTEIIRVLLANEFVPQRTVEVMAYAAEEIGLVGSGEIAAEYAQNGVDVLAFVQFDMTGYKGSSEDIYISTDTYNSSELNTYLTDLIDHYNNSGDHSFTYGYTECGYACSDHASWANNGYNAAFPFEAAFEDSNPNIHSPYDVYSFFNTPDHAAKFAKLGLQFVIEGAKTETLSVPDFTEGSLITYVRNKTLYFELKNATTEIDQIAIYNISGQRVVSASYQDQRGAWNLQSLSAGFYIVQFEMENNRTITKKIVLN